MVQHKSTKRDMSHLKMYQFQKGKSGNPSGRPKGSQTFESLVNKILGEKVPGGVTRREVLARRFIQNCMENNPIAMEQALKRIWPTKSDEAAADAADTAKALAQRVPPDLQDVVAVLAEIGALKKAGDIQDPVSDAIDVTPV